MRKPAPDHCPCGVQIQRLETSSEWARMAQDLATQAGQSRLTDLQLAMVVHVAMVHDDWDHFPQLVSFQPGTSPGTKERG